MATVLKGRYPRITAENKRLLLVWHDKEPRFTARHLAHMIIFLYRNETIPTQNEFSISESTVRRILRDASYVCNMSRPSRNVIFSSATAMAAVTYSDVFTRILELSGRETNLSHLSYADETIFNCAKVPAMVWAEWGLPARFVGNNGNGGIYVFLFPNASG